MLILLMVRGCVMWVAKVCDSPSPALPTHSAVPLFEQRPVIRYRQSEWRFWQRPGDHNGYEWPDDELVRPQMTTEKLASQHRRSVGGRNAADYKMANRRSRK